MLDFIEHPKRKIFESTPRKYLLAVLQTFLGCKVRYSNNPITHLKTQYDIDITQNPNRGTYIIDDNNAVILGRIIENKIPTYAFALHLSGYQFKSIERVLNIFENALARTLSLYHSVDFKGDAAIFSERILESTITSYFGKGYYHYDNFLMLIDLFKKLSNTQFEGRNFTTGLILTRSHYAFKEKGDYTRYGAMHKLESPFTLTPDTLLKKRTWYLADGQTSFYMCNKELNIRNYFVLNTSPHGVINFVDNYYLSSTIMGGDALFRVTSHAEFSITDSRKIEFNYKENQWRVRNLDILAKTINNAVASNNDVTQAILYYLYYLSKRRISSIIWIPNDISIIDEILKSKNKLVENPISIINNRYTQSLFRLLSSDGATIISKDGLLLYFGAVVDISKIKLTGLKGTGELVAKLLGENGLAIKISQDGAIKLHSNKITGELVV